MILFKEINWALHEINRFYTACEINISREYLEESLRNSMIYAGNDIVFNLIDYNFIEMEQKYIRMTSLGHKMLSLAEDKYDLSNEQKKLAFDIYIRKNDLLIKKWLGHFSCEKTSILRSSIDIALQQITENMLSLEVAFKNNDQVSISNNYEYLLIKLSSNMTEEELMHELEKKKELGDIAEGIAYEYEINRLELSEKASYKSVQVISKTDVCAGYDIKSYETVYSESYDRFIEVKYFNNRTFFLTENELNKAKLLEEKYYLYLVNINTKNVTIVRDPYNKLKETAKSFTCVLTKVEM